MKLTHLISSVALAVALGSTPVLADHEKGHGSKKDFVCSPGYYKNHLETWFDMVPFDSQALLDGLTRTGKKNGQVKQAAAAELNGWFLENGGVPCDDD